MEQGKSIGCITPAQTVQKAFCNLYDTLLLAVAYDGTGDRDAALYGYMAEAVTALSSMLNAVRSGK